MKPKQKVAVLCAVDLFLMLMDGLLTFINTPDLKREGNPLVAVMGWGWGALFLANLIIYCLYILGAYYAFVVFEHKQVEANNIKEYISQLYYDRPDKFIWTFYKFPKKWKPVWAMMGYVFSYVAILARLFLVSEWLGVTLGWDMTGYRRFKHLLWGRPDVVISVFIGCILMYVWLKKAYKKNQRLIKCSSF